MIPMPEHFRLIRSILPESPRGAIGSAVQTYSITSVFPHHRSSQISLCALLLRWPGTMGPLGKLRLKNKKTENGRGILLMLRNLISSKTRELKKTWKIV